MRAYHRGRKIWRIFSAAASLLVVAVVAHGYLGAEDASNPDVTIRVTGMQWKWAYEYVAGAGTGVSFFAYPRLPRDPLGDREDALVVPVEKKIRVLLSAVEVEHDWAIPDLRVNQAARPGTVREAWFRAPKLGIYRSRCSTEICRADHVCLPIVIKAVSDADYRTWIESREKTQAPGPGQSQTAALLAPARTSTQ